MHNFLFPDLVRPISEHFLPYNLKNLSYIKKNNMPDGSGRPSRVPTFNTLEREKAFRNPPKDGSTYSILNEFVTPHIESFNALFDDSGLPSGDGDGRGLLNLALQDIGERVVFDGTGQAGTESGVDGWGNRMRSKSNAL